MKRSNNRKPNTKKTQQKHETEPEPKELGTYAELMKLLEPHITDVHYLSEEESAKMMQYGLFKFAEMLLNYASYTPESQAKLRRLAPWYFQ